MSFIMAERIHKENRALVPPFFQIILIVLTTALLGYMLHQRLNIFHSTDPLPTIQLLTPKKFQEFGAYAREIDIGFYLDEFENFNLVDNDFLFTGQIWFFLERDILSLDSLGLFSFEFGNMLERSQPYVQLIGNKIFVRYNVRVHISSTLDLKNFPLDNHRIHIQLKHP